MNSIPPGGDRRNPFRFDRRKAATSTGHLELLSKMSGHLAVTLNIEETIQKALDLIVQFVKAEGGALFMLEEKGSRLVCKASAGPVDIRGIAVKAGEGVIGQCLASGTSRIVRDVSQDPDFARSVDDSTGFRTRSILCAPMNVHNEKIGAIELVNKHNEDGLFSEPDLLMLQTLASAAALAIHNAHMAEELVEQERVTRELELAMQMQQSLLPGPRGAGFPVCGINLPAYEMSGDFYDFFELPDGRISFSLGDVSGKGMDAALLMSKTASLFRCLGKTIHEPDTLLTTINGELLETAIHGMFVTMVCGLLDPASGEVHLANAGHEPLQFHRKDGSFSEITASSPPLGIVPLTAGGDGIRKEICHLDCGTLYIFSDGVTEGTMEDGQHLKVEGFKAIIRQNAGLPAHTRIEAVVSLLRKSSSKRHDDITLLAIDDSSRCSESDNRINEKNLIARHTFPANAEELHGVREVVARACETCRCGQPLATDLIIAVGEACQNVVRHAYKNRETGEATLEIYCKDGILEFHLLDSAPPVDQAKVKPKWPEELTPGGLGVCLIHDIMDEVEYLPAPAARGNLLRMVKRIKRDAANET